MTKNIKKDAIDATMEELKAAFGELHKLEEKKMAKKNPAPNFSSWPPEMPERHHKWRQSDEVQKYRLRVPEPSHVDFNRVLYRIDREFPMHFSQFAEIPKVEYLENESIEKKLFRMKGCSYWAWTVDGNTPVFPIPL